MGESLKRRSMTTIDITDTRRILFGEVPYEFMIEVVIRILFVYILLVIAMRLMGTRLAARITRNELIALVTLSAGVGMAILNPERGLLPPVVVVIVVVSIQYFIARITRKSKTVDKIILDTLTPLIKDGKFQLESMKETRITRERMSADLRANSIKNLGIVERAYMEANGKFTVVTFKDNKSRQGLCVIPRFDTAFRDELHYAKTALACNCCGNVEEKIKHETMCSNCGNKSWERALVGE
jgi:uncharacterized membrane protein YcaP (DUF421 family)